jgi:hypothetical protein
VRKGFHSVLRGFMIINFWRWLDMDEIDDWIMNDVHCFGQPPITFTQDECSYETIRTWSKLIRLCKERSERLEFIFEKRLKDEHGKALNMRHRECEDLGSMEDRNPVNLRSFKISKAELE